MMKKTALERVRDMTRQSLERQADQLFELSSVRSRIVEAAGEGFTFVIIAPEKGVDLSQTNAAKTTTEALHAEGFGVEWEKRQHPDGRTSQAFVIRWSP